MEGGPEPWTTNDGIQARREGVEGSWEGDTKCINVPPQTLLRQRQRGTEATAWDMGGEGAPAISSPGTPQERALLETARWEGPQ